MGRFNLALTEVIDEASADLEELTDELSTQLTLVDDLNEQIDDLLIHKQLFADIRDTIADCGN